MSESSFVIRELTGKKNKLELEGRALPYRPFTLEGGMRAVTTRYPGNPIATLQMLGADEKDTTIGGMWKDRFIKAFSDLKIPTAQSGLVKVNGQVVADVMSAVKAVAGFRLRGQLIEVSWDEVVRHGYLKSFKEAWHRREDVEWEMTFEFISRGESLLPIAFAFQVPSLDIATEIASLIAAVKKILKAPFALIRSFRRQVETIIDSVVAAGDALNDVANSVINIGLEPLKAAKIMASALQTIQNQSTQLINTFRSVPARIIQAGQDIDIVGYDFTLLAEKYARDSRKAARELRAQASLRLQELENDVINKSINKTFYAVQDMDMRDVSTKFYGTPDHWHELVQFNGFRTSRLLAGDTVMIPSPQAGV